MQAVILAGGLGKRLHPYTLYFPKPLMPLGDRPILEIIIQQLKKAGFDEIIISTGYLSDLIKTYFSDGKRFGVRIRYSHEDVLLNTAGALKLVSDLDDNFLVMNGDILTTLDFRNMFDEHCSREVDATIALNARVEMVDFGVVEFDDAGFLQDYIEKPQYDFHVSMGVYILSKKCILLIDDNEAIGMPDLMQRLYSKDRRIYCHIPSDIYWLDIGRVDDYEKAQEKFSLNKELFL